MTVMSVLTYVEAASRGDEKRTKWYREEFVPLIFEKFRIEQFLQSLANGVEEIRVNGHFQPGLTERLRTQAHYAQDVLRALNDIRKAIHPSLVYTVASEYPDIVSAWPATSFVKDIENLLGKIQEALRDRAEAVQRNNSYAREQTDRLLQGYYDTLKHYGINARSYDSAFIQYVQMYRPSNTKDDSAAADPVEDVRHKIRELDVALVRDMTYYESEQAKLEHEYKDSPYMVQVIRTEFRKLKDNRRLKKP
jgi:hypothetical protein